MFERIERSWRLLGEAWGVLRQDTELVMFPILSGIVSLLVLATFAVPMVLALPWNEIAHTSGHASREVEVSPVYYVLGFLYYLASYFVIIFFNSGLVACV